MLLALSKLYKKDKLNLRAPTFNPQQPRLSQTGILLKQCYKGIRSLRTFLNKCKLSILKIFWKEIIISEDASWSHVKIHNFRRIFIISGNKSTFSRDTPSFPEIHYYLQINVFCHLLRFFIPSEYKVLFPDIQYYFQIYSNNYLRIYT